MELVWLVPVTGFGAVAFALWLAWDVLRRDTGTPQMREIAGMILEGANAFLRRQYTTIGMLAVVTAVVIALIVGSVSHGVKEITPELRFGETVVSRWEEAALTAVAFIVGAAASALSGYIGMFIA
ncbi:MAG: sodium/proton-translocating pyrophosphatase, partial [Dehalococcoidia bacterium]|nr:sodium/proton-translocating pyrophosphatase [Dehalococcoidia bacterium]